MLPKTIPTDQHSVQTAQGQLGAALGLVLLLCLPVLLVVAIHRGTDQRLISPGDSVPALTLRDLNSNNPRHVVFKGRPSSVLFFSTDCPHCQREIANFDRLNKMFGENMFFLAISLSDYSKTMELRKSNRLEVTTLLDQSAEARRAFGVEMVPAMFLIKSDGTVAYSGSGEETSVARERLLRDFSNANNLARRQ
ncbi:MAG: TlpA disulfide reductase family protein [Ignavibacteria bacterium]|nr:TlpA disulfide reductase family protein [Ignavibacteria bacterium]